MIVSVIDPVIGRMRMTIAVMIAEPLDAGLRRHRNGTMCGKGGTEVPTRKDPGRTRGERGCRAHRGCYNVTLGGRQARPPAVIVPETFSPTLV